MESSTHNNWCIGGSERILAPKAPLLFRSDVARCTTSLGSTYVRDLDFRSTLKFAFGWICLLLFVFYFKFGCGFWFFPELIRFSFVIWEWSQFVCVQVGPVGWRKWIPLTGLYEFLYDRLLAAAGSALLSLLAFLSLRW